MTPADILTMHAGPDHDRLPALGRAIDAIVFPTAADLSAIAWYAQPKANRIAIATKVLRNVSGLSDAPDVFFEGHAVEMNSCNYLFSRHRVMLHDPTTSIIFAEELRRFNVPALIPEMLANGCISGRITPPPSPKNVSGALPRSAAPPVYAIPAGELLTMQKLVRAIQSQYVEGVGVIGEGGSELWPILADMLMYQIKSGQINDAALSILFSRHSEENCFDYNPGTAQMFYGFIDAWNEQQHPRTDSQKAAYAKQFADAQMVQKAAILAKNRATTMKFTSPTLGAMVACAKAKGTWNAKYKTCTTTRAGKIVAVSKYNPVTKKLVATVTKPKISPMEAILAGAVVAAGVVVAVKIIKKRRARA